MKKNMGPADRIVRILVAIVIIVLYFTNQITGTAAIAFGVLAAIFVVTGVAGICPLYLPFRISTGKKTSEPWNGSNL